MHSPARRAIVIGIDGAGMELVQHLVDLGHLPHLRDLMARGVHRPMLGTYPTLTPPAWTSFATASWPVTHEIMDWTIRVKGEPLSRAKWGIDTRFCKSEYFWNAAERAGKRPILIKFEMSWPPTVTHGIQVEGSGPGVSNFHQIAGYHLFVAGQWAPRPVGGQRDPETVDPSTVHEITTIDPVTLRRAAGWANLPTSVRPPMEVDLILRPLARGRAAVARGRHGVPKVLMGLIYSSGDGGYDRVRICRERNAGEALADLGPRQWSRWWVETFEIDGAPVEGYVGMKLITLTPEAERFELFVPPVWPRTGFTYPAEIAQELDTHVGNFIQNPAREALGVIDDDTYFELLEMHHQRLADVAAYLTSHHSWDLLMIETHAPDYAGHFFLGQADPISGAPPDVVARCLGGVIRTMASVDRLVGRVASLADSRTLVTVVSDHGGTPSRFRSIDVGEILEQAGFLAYRDTGPTEQAAQPTIDHAPGEVPWMVPPNLMGPKREIEWSRSRAAPHGLVHIFINLAGREPGGIVEPHEYESTVRQVIDTLLAYRDPQTGQHPFSLVMSRAEAEVLNLGGDVTGDVVYALRPEFDGAHGRQLPATRFGISGQHSTFVLAGPGVRRGVALRRVVRVVDVVPTLCYLLGWRMPRDAEGGVIYEALDDPDWHLTALQQQRDGEDVPE